MKQRKHSKLDLRRPTMTGDADAIEFAEVLNMLERAQVRGILTATTIDDELFELRIDVGCAVRITGRDGNGAAADVRELITAAALSWSFRATPYAPNGEERTPLSTLLFQAIAVAA